MKNCGSRFLVSLLSIVLFSSATIQAVFPPSFSGPGTLVIPSGITVLSAGANTIDASTGSVTVNLGGSAIIQANTAGSELYLNVAGGNTITFNVTADLAFWGSAPGQDLLIVQSGDGEVIWNIDGGSAVSFTQDSGSGGVEYWLYMDTAGTRATFQRSATNPTLDANVFVGGSSLLSYLSSEAFGTGSSVATFRFDPSNASTGRMALQIADTAGVVIAGHTSTNSVPTTITLADINRALPAGMTPRFEVNNSVGATALNAGLYVLNSNNSYSVSNNGQEGNLLFDPFLVLGTRTSAPYTGFFSGVRYGWVLGANGVLAINDNTYLNYVGLQLDQAPIVPLNPNFNNQYKYRNPSAFIVDGYFDPVAVPALVQFGTDSALYFRSGVNNAGVVENPYFGPNPFTITPALQSIGVGAMVLDVEGELQVSGQSELSSGIQIFSIEVDNGSSSLFIDQAQTIFPGRTFSGNQYNSAYFLINNHLDLFQTSLMHTDQNHLVVKKSTTLSEPTYVGGDTYKYLPTPVAVLDQILARPKIVLENSRFLINESVALTGVDLLVPNLCDADNNSSLTFFYNGYVVDNGTGRNMILGTLIGSTPINALAESVSTAAHVDVMPTTNCTSPLVPGDQLLSLTVAANNCKIIQSLSCPPTDILGQVSMNSIYLNCNSNISVGTNNATSFILPPSNATFQIAGNSFSFDTAICNPANIGVTGTGGIFVDLNGTFTIDPNLSATINTMVVRSQNGVVNLPITEVVFRDGLGITNWQPDMAITSPIDEQILIAAGENLSDFSINWDLQIIKNYESFVPFPVTDISDCSIPTVTAQNVAAIPIVQGIVDQFQIQGSRYSDPATIKVDGGIIHELVFLEGCEPGEYRGAVIVLQNNAIVGIGSADRNTDSAKAAVELGRNGVIFIVNGSGKVILNDDVFVQGACAFITGPDFNPATDKFEIEAQTPHVVRVTKNSILDLRGMDNGASVDFRGYAQLVLEPGSKVLFGTADSTGSFLNFYDHTQLNFQPSQATEIADYFAAIDLADLGAVDNTLNALVTTPSIDPHNQFAPLVGYGSSLLLANNTTGLRNTDPFRVRLIGVGDIQLNDYSIATLPENAFVGVETIDEIDPSCGTLLMPLTVLTLRLTDSAQFQMGQSTAHETGGVLQVGNVQDLGSVDVPHEIIFVFELDGDAAEFIQGPKSVLGLGVGIVRAGKATLNEYFVDNLFNATIISYNHFNGEWTHNRIFSGDDVNASLILLGEGPEYDQSFGAEVGALFDMTNNDSNIAGGGNLALISQAVDGNIGAVAPIVLTQDNLVTVTGGTSARLNVGMFSSMYMRRPILPGTNGQIINVTAQAASTMFNLWRMTNAMLRGTAVTPNNKENWACAGPLGEGFRQTFDQIRIGYVVTLSTGADQIRRIEISNNQIFSGTGGIGAGQVASVNATTALDLSVVHVTLNDTAGSATEGDVLLVSEPF